MSLCVANYLLVFPLFKINYSSIKYKIKIASAASACNETKNVATPNDINSNTPIPENATSKRPLYTQNAKIQLTPAIAKCAAYL